MINMLQFTHDKGVTCINPDQITHITYNQEENDGKTIVVYLTNNVSITLNCVDKTKAREFITQVDRLLWQTT